MSFFRYPGGKSKVREEISKHLNIYSQKVDLEYREPFFGGGSVGLNFISDKPNWKNMWINDKDIGVASLWTALIQYPEELKQMVQEFVPSIERFDKYKSYLTNIFLTCKSKSEIVECGFKKLAIHQTSYSGLGTKSGGPLGGRDQKKYKIDCRWSPDYICKKIDKIHKQFETIQFKNECCTNVDFAYLIKSKKESLLYLDPPYYLKGNDLYQCSFSEMDHKRLACQLEYCNHPWILSYDDCTQIRNLYHWAVIDEISVNYTITGTKDKESGKRIARTKPELLIYSKKHKDFLDLSNSISSEIN